MNTGDLLKRSALVFFIAAGLILASNAMPTIKVMAKPQPGLATQEHEVGGVDVVLLEVKRASGDTLTVRWQLRNKTQENKELTKWTGSWSDAYRLSLDAYLIDPGNKKKYLVLKDEKGNPIAAKHEAKMKGIGLAPGQSLTTWAKFPAPPANVEKISVYLPGVQPFEDIPIGK